LTQSGEKALEILRNKPKFVQMRQLLQQLLHHIITDKGEEREKESTPT
jgi:hypothetical protein